MRKLIVAGITILGATLAGCVTSPEQIECLQPNWRVSVEVGGTRPGLPPKSKPGAKPEAKAGAKPASKPKPQPTQYKSLVQGNSAFAFESATLNAGGKAELDKLFKLVIQGTSRDKRPLTISSVIISGYSDSTEGDADDTSLSVARAKAVRDYLASKGIDQKLIFWEGKGSKYPVPVTKFCS